MKLSFKRITSSGSFIPEIDGLRFIAVASVVLYHFWCFYNAKAVFLYRDAVEYPFLSRILSHGNFGVPLFFAISGLILGMPFAKFHLNNEKKVNIKNYFLRRLTRLEPPYIIVMTMLFFGIVFISKTVSISDQIPRSLTSLVYINNFVYPGLKANGVAWSLEIEVQFYILAPLMAYVFSIRPATLRRCLLGGLTILFLLVNYYNTLPFISLLNYIHYFLIGFLLADFYVSRDTLLPKTRFDPLFAFVFFSVIWLFERGDFKYDYQNFLWELVQVISIFLLYYYVLFHKALKILTFRLITNIGGMCYSIYLLHYYIISVFGNPLLEYKFSESSEIRIIIYSILILIPIVIFSSIFFILVERPCMDKDWYKKIFRKDASKSPVAK